MTKDYQLFRRTTPYWVKAVLTCGLAVALMIVDGKAGRLHLVRNVITTALGVVNQPLHATQRWFVDTFDHAYNLQTLASENQKLMAVNETQAARLTSLALVEKDNADLQAQLKLKTSQYPTGISAQVLYQVADPYARKLVLNKGSQDGIVAGQPVVSADGLLGQITEVAPMTSELTLVIDTKINVPVQLQSDPNTRGFISGDSNEGFLVMRFFTAVVPLQVGDVLETSGKDGLYPAKIPVGKILSIQAADANGQSSYTVGPVVAGMAVRYVLVLNVSDATQMAQRAKEQAQKITQDGTPNTLGARVRAQAQAKEAAQSQSNTINGGQ